jgi:hypothetical protein
MNQTEHELPFALSLDDERELYALAPRLYPRHLTPAQAVARYRAWVAEGLRSLDSWRSGQLVPNDTRRCE